MPYSVEILSRYASERDVNELLYAPVQGGVRYRTSRRYVFEAAGDEHTTVEFARKVLLDDIGEEIYSGPEPALQGFGFYLDISLKPGLLDLERDHILRYAGSREDAGSNITALTVIRRIYVFGNDATLDAKRLLKDMVNPVIHTWSVGYGASRAN